MINNVKLILNKEQILEYQNNFGDFLMIDYATNIYPGKSAEGYKDLDLNLWFFKLHWPGDPNMPAALQLESLSQMASLIILSQEENKKKFMYLVSHQYTIFKKKVIPGDRMNIKTNLIKWKRGVGNFYGEAEVNSSLVCKAEFTMILPDELNKFNLI
jgi:3-hydroxyacyl-[acyl-carrier-protein] dehydratase